MLFNFRLFVLCISCKNQNTEQDQPNMQTLLFMYALPTSLKLQVFKIYSLNRLHTEKERETIRNKDTMLKSSTATTINNI